MAQTCKSFATKGLEKELQSFGIEVLGPQEVRLPIGWTIDDRWMRTPYNIFNEKGEEVLRVLTGNDDHAYVLINMKDEKKKKFKRLNKKQGETNVKRHKVETQDEVKEPKAKTDVSFLLNEFCAHLSQKSDDAFDESRMFCLKSADIVDWVKRCVDPFIKSRNLQ